MENFANKKPAMRCGLVTCICVGCLLWTSFRPDANGHEGGDNECDHAGDSEEKLQIDTSNEGTVRFQSLLTLFKIVPLHGLLLSLEKTITLVGELVNNKKLPKTLAVFYRYFRYFKLI